MAGEDNEAKGVCLTIGNFDGVHLGHRSLIETAKKIAAHNNLAFSLMTFWPHPRTVVQGPVNHTLLTTRKERARLLARAGASNLIELPFTREFAGLAPQEFVEYYLAVLNVRALVIGHDFSLGRDREGTSDILRGLGAKYGFVVIQAVPFRLNGNIVSSTRLREAIASGDVTTAAAMLGRNYVLEGQIGKGFGRGRELGYPTANLENIETLLPASGVYAAWAAIDGQRFPAITNIGINPTFANPDITVETFLLEGGGDLYGKEMRLEFAAKIRNERKFDSPKALAAQIGADIGKARDILNGVMGNEGDSIVMNVVSLTNEGKGIGFLPSARGRGPAVFVQGAVPGQKILCKLIKNRKNFWDGELTQILNDETEGPSYSRCDHYGECGGCALMPLLYGDQQFWKEAIAREAMLRIGRIAPEELESAWLPMPNVGAPDAYRNKMEFAFGQKDGILSLGMRKPYSHEVVDTPDCQLLEWNGRDIVKKTRELTRAAGFTAWNGASGFLRFLTLRKARAVTDDRKRWHALMLTSPGDRRERKKIANLGRELLDQCPDLFSFTHEVRQKKDWLPIAERRVAYFDRNGGAEPPLLQMAMGYKKFFIDSKSFFQVNTRAGNVLADMIRDFDKATEGPLLDVYCGVGFPGQLLWYRHNKCLGIDREGIRFAEMNARASGLNTWKYLQGDAGEILREMARGKKRWPTVLLDPPRAGMSKQALQAIINLAPNHIIHISCNPATMARDAAQINKRWRLVKFACVDMFPQTAHMECCALWARRW